MSLTTRERFTGYPCLFDSITVNHIRSLRTTWAPQKGIIIPSGAVTPQVIAEISADHKAEIVSGDLVSVLAAVNPTSCYVLSGSGAVLQFQQRLLGGTFTTGSTHLTNTSPAGVLYVEEVSGTQDAKEGATLKLAFIPLWNGSTSPVTPQVGQALSGSVAVNGLFKLWGIVYEGTVVMGVKSISYKTGIKMSTMRVSGDVWPATCSIEELRPTLTIKGTNMTWPTGIGPDLLPMTDGITAIFQNVTPGITGNHNVSITFGAGVYSSDGMGASGTGDAESTVMADLTGSVPTFSTTAALP
jgi:hypothetical protein